MLRPRTRREHRAAVAVEQRVTATAAAAAATRGARGAAVVCGATATAGGYNDGGEDPTVGLSEWWTTFTKARWDEGPKSWKEFWAIKVRACVFVCGWGEHAVLT